MSIWAYMVNTTRIKNSLTFNLVTRGHKNSNWVISFFLLIKNNSSITTSLFWLINLVLSFRDVPFEVFFSMALKALQILIFGLEFSLILFIQPSFFFYLLFTVSRSSSLVLGVFEVSFVLKDSLIFCIVKDYLPYIKLSTKSS